LRQAVATHLEQLESRHSGIDYITLVPDGEPTLDLNVGRTIEALKAFEIPIAVVTNASQLWRREVRARLNNADLVSIKVDSVDEAEWRRINRPHPGLKLEAVLQGIREFAAGFAGTLISETMLLAGINESNGSLVASADFLAGIKPRTAYLAIPIRPTTVADVEAPGEKRLIRAYEIFSARLGKVELLTGHEAGDFGHTGDARRDLLAITAVHPMREEAVRRLLADDQAQWTVIEELVTEGLLKVMSYQGERFYLRPVARG
jgi:wyosine [tRNA(Phe)-imidazoG37] synthetase (radical SAM superfamily)